MKSKNELAAEQLAIEMEAKAAELSEKFKCKVTPVLLFHNGDPVKGYLKEPNRLAKIRILDKSNQLGDYSAAAEMLELCLIEEESDKRLLNESPEYDALYIGACRCASDLVTIALNYIKKK